MRKFDKSVMVLFIMLLLVGGFFVAVIYNSSAQAVEPHAHEQFKTSPKDVTNSRVLEKQTAAKIGAIVSVHIGAVIEAIRDVQEPVYVESDYYVSGYKIDYSYQDSESYRYTEYYPSENTGAFAYAPDLEITLGDDGAYRDKDGYVIVASSSLDKFDTVETPYGEGRVYDTGCAAGVVDIYTNNG